MSKAAEGDEVFEISDFTLASPWEKFVGAIEDVLVRWSLHGDAKGVADAVLQAHRDRKNTLTAVIPYLGEHFCLTYFLPLPEDQAVEQEAALEAQQMPSYFPDAIKMALNRVYDWPTRAHPLSRWYGVTTFVVLAYASSNAVVNTKTPDIDLSRCSQLLSSLCLAAAHVKSALPCFVPLSHRGQHIAYMGYCVSKGTTTTFKSTLYPANALANATVAKIIDIYRNKVGIYEPHRGGMLLSTRYTYVRRSWPDDQWRKNLLTTELLRWGPDADPLLGIGLGLAWAFHSKDDNFPTLTPQWPYDIPTWYLACSLAASPVCQFTEMLREVFRSLVEARAYTSIDQLQHYALEAPSLAESLQSPRLPSPAELDRIMRSLFKDASHNAEIPESHYLYVTELHGAPITSLFSQVAIDMFNMQSLRGMLQVWFLFVKNARSHWAQGKPLPGVPADKIDLRCSLIFQKLQMLNYCLRRKRKSSAPSDRPKLTTSSTGESDARDLTSSLGGAPLRDGAKEHVAGLAMLNSGLPIWAPEVQEIGVMTEDMVAEQLDLLTRLGSDTAGAEMRARLQISSLESDMQAFKAANPGCCLEDFVRWYSPRDWIESAAAPAAAGGGPAAAHESHPNSMGATLDAAPDTPAATAGEVRPRGALSKRMQEPGNLWAQTWAAAKPVPISRQRPLFQTDVEAEKALHYLETVSPIELITQMLRAVFTALLFQFSASELCELPTAKDAVSYLASKMLELLRHTPIWDEADGFLTSCHKVEVILAQLATLHTKFEGRARLYMDLYRLNEAYLDVSPDDRKVILKLFAEGDGIPQPEMKEFIVRSVTTRPAPTSRPVGNRMYVILNEPASEYRISTMLSLDE